MTSLRQAHSGKLKEEVEDRLDLMRRLVYGGTEASEVRGELVSEAEGIVLRSVSRR